MGKDSGLISELLAELDEKQRQFVIELAETGNQSQSALKAGYCTTLAAAAVTANRQLKIAKVNAAYKALKKLKSDIAEDKFRVTQEAIIKELASQSFSNIKRIVKIKNGEAEIQFKSPRDAAAVKSFSFSRSNGPGMESKSFNVVFHDKVKALGMLAKITGMLDDGSVPGSDDKKSVRERLFKALGKIGQ